MSLTTTYSTGAVALGATRITLNAYTAPSAGAIGPVKMLRWATGEYALITDDSNSPTLIVVPGWNGSRNVAHSAYEGVQYGLANDASWPAGPAANVQIAPVTITNAQEVTITGSTGTDAAVVTVPWPGFLNCSGASGAGLNLPVPVVGAQYVVHNAASGAVNVYCVGGSINGTTGTTAVTITTTGTDGDIFWCATAGAWQTVPNSI
jgi:hypothetical protein